MLDYITKTITDSILCKQQLLANEQLLTSIVNAANCCIQALKAGHKILLAGNGGSAADAQHIAAELVGRFQRERHALPAIALTTDTSILTAVGNDYGFEQIFARQVQGLGQAGDVFIGLSTSGQSANVIHALQSAQQQGLHCIGLTGENGAQVAEISAICINVPSSVTSYIQECHIMIGHMLCGLIDEGLA